MHKITLITDEGLTAEIMQALGRLNNEKIKLVDASEVKFLRSGSSFFFLITQRPEYWEISPEYSFNENCLILAGFKGTQLIFARKLDLYSAKGPQYLSRRIYGQILWEVFSAEYINTQGSLIAFFDLTGLALLAYSYDGVLLYANEEVENLTGWPVRELYVRSVDEYLRPVDGMNEEMHDLSQLFREPGMLGPLHFQFFDGTWQTLVYHSYLIPLSTIGQEVLLILIGTYPRGEMTGMVELGNKLHERAILHDFRNLLQSVVTYTDLLGFEIDPNSTPYGYLEKMRSELRRAQEILRHLMYPESTTESTALRVDQYVESLVNTIKEIAPQNISIEFNPGCPYIINISPIDLGRILRNLVKNALEAIGNSPGRIQLKTEKSNPDNTQGDREFVKIEVSDNGPGISEPMKENIFQPFFTTHKDNGGTGLGLYSVQTTVKQYGGVIDFKSHPGVGTTFVVYLPLANQ
ncbi:MAG: two-component system sensor histidine kinase NtrB [Bacteroidales bacterium]